MKFSPEKTEYAKLAIPITVSKGQALRVFEKNLHLAGRIFCSKNLGSRRFIAFNLHNPFFFFFEKNNCCF
jgi:hypothetical protein